MSLRRLRPIAWLAVFVGLSSVGQAAELANVVAITAGSSHSCALTTAGGVKCWGAFEHSQFPASSMAVDVPSATSGIAAIAAGGARTCALATAGSVTCWGNSTNPGQPLPSYSPPPGTTIASLSVGNDHACVLTTGGGVKCWGANTRGQLGNGSTTRSDTPVDVLGLTSGATAIAAGAEHSCALMAGGTVKCWGGNRILFLLQDNPVGQLGNGTFDDNTTPVDVVDLPSNVVAIASGAWSSCARAPTGGVKCWGAGYGNRAVDAPGLTSGVPMLAVGGSLVRISSSILSAPYQHTCTVTSAGGVKCSGRNSWGQLGSGSNASETTAVDVLGLASGITAVAAGAHHTCALTSTGRVRCWGLNSSFQLGDGNLADGSPHTPPADVVGMTSGVASISAGRGHTCALTTAGGAKCWGANTISTSGTQAPTGALGDGTFTNRLTPVDVAGLASGVARLDAGDRHTCAVTSGGAARCWGDNAWGQLGDGTKTTRNSPVMPTGLATGMLGISGGQFHSCGLSNGGFAKCWGNNIVGAIGDGTTAERLSPTDIAAPLGASSQIAAGGSHSCAVTSGGAVMCWGANSSGQLGDGTTTTRLMPTPVAGLGRGMVAVVTGNAHSCALTATGGVKCWGSNFDGQLGSGSTTNIATPIDVIGLASGVTAISAKASHTCARTSSGNAMCWGNNQYGQLGDGSFTQRPVPVTVTGLGGSVASISAGNFHTCAVTTGGGAKCWGSNSHGEVGNGLIQQARPFPAAVIVARAPGRFLNISTRGQVFAGNDVMIAGFIIGGSTPKTLVANVAGPSLAGFGIANPLQNPTLTLVRQSDGQIIAANDNWQSAANAAQIQASGFAPANALEPAIMMTLPPGAYTAIVQGVGGTGVGLVGLFEVDGIDAPLINISTRGQVLTGNDVLIAGFIVQGSGPQTVVINVAGPSLSAFGIANPLANPKLTLVRSSDSEILMTNDDWQSSVNPAGISMSGFTPAHPLEPAILMTLAPGAYTAIVEGVGGTGVALVGVFRVP